MNKPNIHPYKQKLRRETCLITIRTFDSTQKCGLHKLGFVSVVQCSKTAGKAAAPLVHGVCIMKICHYHLNMRRLVAFGIIMLHKSGGMSETIWKNRLAL